jgi:hypothetical protein
MGEMLAEARCEESELMLQEGIIIVHFSLIL